MKQGEIVLVEFPFTNQQNAVYRPALVISNSALDSTQDIILVQITTNLRNDKFSVPFDNNRDLTKPLKYPSEIRCHKVFLAEKRKIGKSVSVVNKNILNQVVAKINSFIST